MPRTVPFIATGLLLLCGVLLAWPVITGGWQTYLDNPAHLAEIHSLAFDDGNGWSDIAWLGFPLGQLHSPLWFGGLAALARAGVAADPLYGFLVVAGFLTPPLVMLGLAWRRAGAGAAVALAWLLLLQKTTVVGFGSPLGGMWTFAISCGLLLLLMAKLADDRDEPADVLAIAALYGLLGLTHLFTIVPAVLVFAIHAGGVLARRAAGRRLALQAGAAALGAAASAAYWAPHLMSGDGLAVVAYNLPPLKLLARLVLGTPMPELVQSDPDYLSGFSLLGVLPQIVLVAAGAAGFVLNRGRSRLATQGFLLAALLLVLLLGLGVAQTAGVTVTWLGHVSWRLLDFVRLGLALAALPLAQSVAAAAGARLRALGNGARTATAAAVVVAVAAWSWAAGGPLRAETLSPRGAQMQEIRQLWDWLAANHQPDWGRVYLQDPFGAEDALGHSHVMALTRRETGVDQVGPLYAGSPFPTTPWLLAESRKLFGRPLHTLDDFRQMMQRIPAANATHLVLYWPELADELVKEDYARQLYRSPNFAVLAMVAYPDSRWAEPLADGIDVRAERLGAARWRVTTESAQAGGEAVLKVTWSPHWRITAGDGPRLHHHQLGLVGLADLPAGRRVTVLEYAPPRWPGVVSLAAWGVWLLALLAHGIAARRPAVRSR